MAGSSTPGSYISLDTQGVSSWSASVTDGTFSTTFYFEGSIDSTDGLDGNWVGLFGRLLGNSGNENHQSTTLSNQLFEGTCGGLKFIRIRAVGGSLTAPPTISIRAGTVATISIGTPLPTGANIIGVVNVGTTGGLALDSTLTGGDLKMQVTDGTGHFLPTGDSSVRSIHTTLDNLSVAVTGTFFQATQPISGTVTANAGTGPFPVAGTAASGSADSGNPIKTGGIFNTTQPIVTNGQRVDNQSTARGAQIVATGVDVFNVTVNAALPAGSNVIGHVVTDSGSTTVVTGTVAVTQSGNWSVRNQDGSGNAITSTGNALDINIKTSSITLPVSLTSTTVTGTVAVTQSGAWTTVVTQPTGTNLHAVLDSGTLTTITNAVTVAQATAANLNATVVGTGTFAVQAAQSGAWTVTANIGTTNGLALDASVTSLQVTQGSTTSGQKGGLTLGAVTTAAPSYTTAQSSPLSLTPAGALRVDGSGATQPVSGTITANAGTGNFTVVQATGTNLHAVIDSGTITAVTAITNALPAGANVIGHVITDTGSTTAVTGTVTVAGTVTANAGTGNFTVVQATAANLNATVVGTGTFAVQAAQSGNWTTRFVGNAGASVDGVITAATAPANMVVGGGVFNSTPLALATGQSAAVALDTAGRQYIATPQKATYRAATAALFAAPAATTIFFIITGSGTKTIRVQRISVAGLTSGTLGVDRVQCAKYSTAPATGTAVALTQVPLDSNFAAGSATLCQVYTAAPGTAPTKIGDIGSMTMLAKSTTIVDGAEFLSITWDFRSVGDTSPVVLRGNTQGVGLYFNVAPAATANCQVEVEWTEE